RVQVYVIFAPGDGQPAWRGWTSGPELFLTFSGQWADSEELRFLAEKYLTHEVLHLWNGWVRESGVLTPPWLTEGYAEYFALDLMVARGAITVGRMQALVLERSARCLHSLDVAKRNG